MYRFVHDPESALYAAAFSGGGRSDDDFRAHVEQLRIAGQSADGRRVAAVIRMIPGHPFPTAYWRSEVAKMVTSGNLKADLAVLSNSNVIRGVLSAVSWLVPRNSARFRMFTSWEAAESWLAEGRGAPIDGLEAMLEEVVRASSPEAKAS
jgi:hypothetical protein